MAVGVLINVFWGVWRTCLSLLWCFYFRILRRERRGASEMSGFSRYCTLCVLRTVTEGIEKTRKTRSFCEDVTKNVKKKRVPALLAARVGGVNLGHHFSLMMMTAAVRTPRHPRRFFFAFLDRAWSSLVEVSEHSASQHIGCCGASQRCRVDVLCPIPASCFLS